MIYIKKHERFKDRIVGKLEGEVLEYDEETVGRIIEETWNLISYKKEEGRAERGTKIDLLNDRLCSPYYISENEKPEFEIYKYKKELKSGKSY